MEIAIQKLFAQILFWLLEFLDAIFEIFRVLCGIDAVEYNDAGEVVNKSLVEIFLQSSAVTKAFLLIFLVAIVVCAISVIVAVVKNALNLKGGERKSHFKTVGQGFGTIIVTFVTAFVMIFGIWGSNEVLKNVYYATSNGSTVTLANRIFDMCIKDGYVSEEKIVNVQATDSNGELMWQTSADGTLLTDADGNPLPLWETDLNGNIVTETISVYKRNPETGDYIIEGGWRDGHSVEEIKFGTTTVDQVFGVHHKTFGLEQSDKGYKEKPMVEMKNFNFVLAYFITLMILVAIVFSMLGLVKRIFDIVALFIMLPLVSATIPLDDGARFKSWRNTVISKVVLAYGAVISVNVFLLVVPVIQNINYAAIWNNGNNADLLATLFKAFLLVGGALCINGGQLLLARILGTSADESREMAQSARALLSGAMAGGSIARGVKNAAIGGTNKYGRQTSGILPTASKVLGGAANVAGNVLGGAAYRSAAQKASGGVQRVANVLRGATTTQRPGTVGANASSALKSSNNGSALSAAQSENGGKFRNGLIGAMLQNRTQNNADKPFLPALKSGKGSRFTAGGSSKSTPTTPQSPSNNNGAVDRASKVGNLFGDDKNGAYKPPKK